jgi:hypothetical protein
MIAIQLLKDALNWIKDPRNQNAWGWIKNPRNQTVIMLIAITVLVILFLRGCDETERLKAEIRMKDNNIIALNDTVRTEKTKSGEMQQVKTILMADMKELRDLNRNLYDEVKDQRNKVFYISKITAQLNDKLKNWNPTGDHVYDPVTGTDNISWNFDTTGTGWGRRTSGRTSFKVTSSCSGYTISPQGSYLENLSYNFSIVTGLKESERFPGSLEIFVNSSYPGMIFDKIDGSIVNPSDFRKYLPSEKPKRWTIGPYAGFSYGITLQENPSFAPVLGVGVGIQYKVISF